MSALRDYGLTPEELQRIIRADPRLRAALEREPVKDKSYQRCPLGQAAAGYLRVKKKRLTDASHRDY